MIPTSYGVIAVLRDSSQPAPPAAFDVTAFLTPQTVRAALGHLFRCAFSPIQLDFATMSLSSPRYQFPMDDFQLSLIGRITLIWSQIDMQIDHMLMKAFDINHQQFDHLFSNRTVTPKCESLRNRLRTWPDPELKSLVSRACEKVKSCAPERNLVTHGIWGWYWNSESNTWEAQSWSRSKNNFIKLSEIPDFYNKLVDTSFDVDIAHERFLGLPVEAGNISNRRIIFASSAPGSASSPSGPPPDIMR